MRTRVVVSCALVCLAMAVSTQLKAQFRPPTNEELKMSSDPKAPGAAAVYLNVEEIENDPLHFGSYYGRIKVLTEKGKELATVQIPVMKSGDKIGNLKGRTIHTDGTIIPMTEKAEEVMVSGPGGQQVARKVITLPNVEVGSILEYSFQIMYDDTPSMVAHQGIGAGGPDLRRGPSKTIFDADSFAAPTWNIQGNYFIHNAHYQFTPFRKYMYASEYSPMAHGNVDSNLNITLLDNRGRVVRGLLWWQHLPPEVKMNTSAGTGYSLDMTDIPGAPEEEWMPPAESALYKVGFIYCYDMSAFTYWTDEVKLWSKDVDKIAEPSNAIKAAVGGLVAATDSDMDKAKKLYSAVQALDNTDFSRKSAGAQEKRAKVAATKHAEDTWAQKSGSSEDIAILYLAMLRGAGLTAYAVKVVDRDRNNFEPGNVSLSQLDSTLVYLSAGDKQILLDPGEKMCPFETVSWRHSYAQGVAESAQGASVAATPMQQYNDNTTTRTGDISVDAQGGVTGQVRIIMTGQEALRWRQEALRNDNDEVKKRFDSDLQAIVPEGVEARVDHFLGMDDPNSNLMATVSIKGSLGAAKGISLPVLFLGSHGHTPFVNEDKRVEPVDMNYGGRVTDQITYHLPEGKTVDGGPQNSNFSWTGHALFVVKTTTPPGQVVVTDTLARAFTFAKPDEYQQLRGFYEKLAVVDQEKWVLSGGGEQKNN